MLNAMTETKIVPVPYRGGAPAVNDLIGGDIDLMFNSVLLALPYFGAKRIRPLAVSSATRAEVFPEVEA